jgi:phage shock protein PspC (stress-responsive transcriptional regulator)
VAFAVSAFFGGTGIAAYLACLLLIPEEGTDESIASSLLDSVQHGSRR